MKIVAFFLLTFLLTACSTTIYVVRHAEKAAPDATMSSDVNLSAAGMQRAQALRQKLGSEKLDAVFATQYKRTQQTVDPAATHNNLSVKLYQANRGNALLDSLSRQRNKKFLVAGHSNTVPAMIRSLGVTLSFTGDIPDNDYDNLFVIKVKHGNTKSIRVAEQTYGAISP